MKEIGIWASIVAAVFAVLAVLVPLALRWWDSRAHLDIQYYLGDDPPSEWVVELGSERLQHRSVLMVRVVNVGTRPELLADVYLAVPGAGNLYPFASSSGGRVAS